jgi:GGDEF domain-containing protein
MVFIKQLTDRIEKFEKEIDEKLEADHIPDTTKKGDGDETDKFLDRVLDTPPIAIGLAKSAIRKYFRELAVRKFEEIGLENNEHALCYLDLLAIKKIKKVLQEL